MMGKFRFLGIISIILLVFLIGSVKPATTMTDTAATENSTPVTITATIETSTTTPPSTESTAANTLPASSTIGGAETTTMATLSTSTPSTTESTAATTFPASSTIGGAETTTMATLSTSTPSTTESTAATTFPASSTIGGAETTTVATQPTSMPPITITTVPKSTTAGEAVTTSISTGTTSISTPTTTSMTTAIATTTKTTLPTSTTSTSTASTPLPATTRAATATTLPTLTTAGGAVTTTMATSTTTTATTTTATASTTLPTSATAGGAVTTTLATASTPTAITSIATPSTSLLTSTTAGGAVATTTAPTSTPAATTTSATPSTTLLTSTTPGGAVTTTTAPTSTPTATTTSATPSTTLLTSTTLGGAVTTTTAPTSTPAATTTSATPSTTLLTSTTPGGAVTTTTATTSTPTASTTSATPSTSMLTSTTAGGVVTTTTATTSTPMATTTSATPSTTLLTSTTPGGAVTITTATTSTATASTTSATPSTSMLTSTTAGGGVTTTTATTSTPTASTTSPTPSTSLLTSTTAGGAVTTTTATTSTPTATTTSPTPSTTLLTSTTPGGAVTTTTAPTSTPTATTTIATPSTSMLTSTTAGGAVTTTTATTSTPTASTTSATPSTSLLTSTTAGGAVTTTTATTSTPTATTTRTTPSTSLLTSTTAGGAVTTTSATTLTPTATTTRTTPSTSMLTLTTAAGGVTITSATTSTPMVTTTRATPSTTLLTTTTAGGAVSTTTATTSTPMATTTKVTPSTALPTLTTAGGAATTKMTTSISAPTTTRTEIATATTPSKSTTVGGAVVSTKATNPTKTPTTAEVKTADTLSTTARLTITTALPTSKKFGGAMTTPLTVVPSSNTWKFPESTSIPNVTMTAMVSGTSYYISSWEKHNTSTTNLPPLSSTKTITFGTESQKTLQTFVTAITTESPVISSSPCPKDCAGDCNGNATINVCGLCVGGSTNRSIDFGQDCAGNCSGTANKDFCGYCVFNGDPSKSKFKDCKGICYPPGITKYKAVEICKECLFPNETSKAYDVCGVCNGQNKSCTDCAGTINGTLRNDSCGICGGNGSTCNRLDSFWPRIIPSSTTKIAVFGAGFNPIISVLLLKNGTQINDTDWKIKNSTFLQMTVTLEPGLYKLRVNFNSTFAKDSTANLTVYNKTSYNNFDVTPLEFVLGTQVSFRINGSLPSDFICNFYSSKNISLGYSLSKNYSCLVPNLNKSDRLFLNISFNGSEPLDQVFQLTGFAQMPSVDSCQFGATGAEIDITFRQKIDTSKLDSCGQIFSDINSLGKGAKCIWRSLRILSIIIGQGDNLIVPGSNLTFKSGSVKVDGELYALALNDSVTVTKPSKPLPTKAIITGPARLPVCGTVPFSGAKSTGAGGRNLHYEWSLNTLVGNLSSFEVNTTELDEGTKYSLTLKVTNFMSDWITSTLEVVRESQAIPIVYITSNVDTSSVQLSDTFHLHANVILPPCVSAGVTYLWSAKANNKVLNLDTTWASLNRYRVQKNELPGGSVVMFTVKVSRQDNATIFSESSIEVTVTDSPLIALIRGGEFRTVGVDSTQNLVLDASLSSDPDYDGTADPNLKFDWTCLQESQGQKFPCYIGTSFKNHSSKTSPLLRLAISDLQANNKYSFSVNVYKGRRKAFAMTIIEVTEGDPPEVELEPLPRGGLVLPTEPLWLRTYIRSSTPVTVEWSTLDTGKADESFLNLNDSSNLLRPALTVNTQQNGVHFSIIVIKPNILQKGSTYTLRVTAKNSASSHFGIAETKFSVLHGITSCILKVPSSYKHLQSINLAAERCTTDNGANPLIYQFFADQVNGNSFPLSVKSTNPQTSVAGPRYGDERNITFSVKVCNSFVVCVRIQSSSVEILQLTTEELVKEKTKIINQVDEYLKTKDYHKAILTLVNVVNINIAKRRRKRMVTPVQVTDEITAKALSIIEKSLSVTPSLNQAANIGQIISQLNDARINNTDLESLFSYIMTLVETYKNQQTTLPLEIMKSVFAKASIAPQRDGFSIDILRKLFLRIQSFSGKFTQSNSFTSPQVDSSTMFSIFGSPINLPHSNEIILDVGTQIKDRYRDWTCENNRKCQGAIIRVLSYRDAQEIFPVNSTTLKVQSDIVDIGLYNPNTGDGIQISNLTDKINFEMKINSIGSDEKHVCLYWDASQMTWLQMSEAVVNRTTSTGICSSSHLSMFVVASKTSTNIDTGTDDGTDAGNSVLVGGIAGGVLATILIGILAVVFWKYHKDRSNRVRPFNENDGPVETEA